MKKLFKFFLTILSSFFIFSGIVKNTPESDHINQARRMANETTEEAQQEPGIINNTGYLEEVYFNSNISEDEYYSTAEKLTYTTIPNFDKEIYVIYASEDLTNIGIFYHINREGFDNYGISIVNFTNQTEVRVAECEFGGAEGNLVSRHIIWHDESPYLIQKNIISEYEALGLENIGNQNHLLTNLATTNGIFAEPVPNDMSINNIFEELGTGLATLAVGFGNIFSGITPIFWNAETNSLTIVSVLAIGSVALTIAFWAISKVLSLTKMGFGKR